MTLEMVRTQFPNAVTAPDPTCKRCCGTGVDAAMTVRAALTTYLKGEKPCICLYVDADLRDFVAESLGSIVKNIGDELNEH